MTLAQQSATLIDWEWVARNWGEIVDRTWEHVTLTAVSVGLGLVISLALSIVALRWRWTLSPITWTTGLLYTIPSLALFALLVPIVGLNATNAVIALTSYTLLILIRNLVAGVDGVPAPVLEAADGMGYTRRSRFWKMEVPLALPVIVAGLRIATVTTVGLVTVTAVLGLGGYGYFILRGLNTFFWTQIIVGVVLSVVLATILDVGFVLLQRVLSPWSRSP
ncbi:MAG TPA: ABC transporter permease, partial [Acidimicrobiia bacterium]|nr:ABC transporter permease [Acidimicrobiia bacterium]